MKIAVARLGGGGQIALNFSGGMKGWHKEFKGIKRSNGKRGYMRRFAAGNERDGIKGIKSV
ncbi:hypothetical protein FACS1894139_06930 [Planctomycetales bacterium]|nr:hypothetical protein FACS1894108_10620 [Planctomycetales bacterium]GHT04578.1 hypothetical protein FACS1894139_06930 [Planctomycetales bacterium]